MTRLRLAVFVLVAFSAADVVHSAHLFGSGPSALSWESNDLTRVRELHKRTFDDPEKFAEASDVASYLGLSSVEGIHLPIPVNVVLIGFDGDGKTNVRIRPEELHEWFSTLDHILPHTRVPLSELTCKEDGMCLHFESVRKPKPLHSYVHYNVSVHAIEVTSELSLQFAKTLKALSRPDSLDVQTSEYQVDVTSLEGVVDGMLAELGILWSYNILLINPDLHLDYVYRAGFSKAEIDYLSMSTDAVVRLKKLAGGYANHIPIPPGHDMVNRKWHPARGHEKFDVDSLMQESNLWSYQIQSWIQQRMKIVQRIHPEFRMLKDIVLMKGMHEDAPLTELLSLLSQNAHHRSKMSGAGGLRVLEPEEGCALDMWAGHRRWILIDLAARPVDWGPLVGGDGVKTIATLPSLEDYFLQKPPTEEANKESENLREKLKTQRDERMENLHAYKVEGYVPKDIMRDAEIDLLSRFHSEHCAHSTQPPVFCQRLHDALTELSKDENVFAARDGNELFLEWFGMDEDGDEAEMEHEGRMKDLFLAHASALVSRAVRHVFIPPTLTWKHNNSEDMDISTPYAKSVTFRIYLLTDAPRDLTEARMPFDTENLKKELTGLKLDRQEFHFVVRHQNILDDPFLSSSLAASLRSSALESLKTEESFQTEERLYFDSLELRSLLTKQLFGNASPQKKTTAKTQEKQLEVPIFVLILDRDRPIFIDRHYVARALEDMVIVVQNSQYRGQHPLGITCGPGIVGQMLAAPLKATLAAVLQYLGGILPSHLGYSPEHRAIAHDWMWSIGANPFSMTSPGWKISQAQKDALHRTYLLDSVDLSIEMINHGIRLLESMESTDQTFEFVQNEAPQFIGLLKDFSDIVEMWRRVLMDAGNMDFEKATLKLSGIENTAKRFLTACTKIESGIEPLRCRGQERYILGIGDEVVGGCLLVCVCIALYKCLPKRRKKKHM